jgi:hypothetical protein
VISVIIPALNEEEPVGAVVREYFSEAENLLRSKGIVHRVSKE